MQYRNGRNLFSFQIWISHRENVKNWTLTCACENAALERFFLGFDSLPPKEFKAFKH